MGVLGFCADLARALGAVARVESDRRRLGIHQAVRRARGRAALVPERSPSGRKRLKKAISMADALMPGGRNCVRRSLLEISLDSGAAKERLLAGFVAGGGYKSGHAWLESEPTSRKFDAVVTL
jgi:hypothetical protein